MNPPGGAYSETASWHVAYSPMNDGAFLDDGVHVPDPEAASVSSAVA